MFLNVCCLVLFNYVILTNETFTVTHGKLNHLQHFDSKAMVEEYIRSLNIPASFVLPSFFMSNVPPSIKTAANGQGLNISWMLYPDTSIPMLDVPDDFGKFVVACLLHPNETMGKHILASSSWVTPREVCAAVEASRGTKTTFTEAPSKAYDGHAELLDNMLMIRDYGYYGTRAKEAVQESQALVPDSRFSTFQSFIKTH